MLREKKNSWQTWKKILHVLTTQSQGSDHLTKESSSKNGKYLSTKTKSKGNHHKLEI